MELFKAPTRTWLRILGDNINPVASIPTEENESIWFDHIDGMYSYCKNKQGETVHLVAWTNVEVDEEMIDEPAPTRIK